MTKLKETSLPNGDLLFDPNNYRFQDEPGFVYASPERFHEDSVQQRAYQRLKRDESLVPLKKSIQRNGYVPIERLVVRPLAGAANRWLVLEGNRRLAAVRWILEDYDAGVDISTNVLDTIRELPVTIVEEDVLDEVFRASLMGIRHVSSIKQWGGYQRSKLVVDMRDKLGLELIDIAERLGLSAQEVNRRYRAFKALEQMQNDEVFGSYATPAMYPLFHEAVSQPEVRTWLGWNEEQTCFTNPDELRAFYDLLTPSVDSEGDEVIDAPPKITTYQQVRDLKAIIPKPDAKKLLLDPTRPFQEALSASTQEQVSRRWVGDVAAAIRSLENMGINELKNLSSEDEALLKRLLALVAERLQDRESIAGSGYSATAI